MIKKLQQRFILITMVSLLVVLSVMVALINGFNLYRIDQRNDSLLKMISDNSGRFPEVTVEVKFRHAKEWRPEFQLELTEETPFETRYFWVRSDSAEDINDVDINNVAAVTAEEAKAYGQEVLANGGHSGYLGLYKYRVTTQADGGKLVVFVDCSTELNGWLTFLVISIAVSALCFVAVMILVAALSRRALAPVIENMAKQKQFIMDAGHELKTPLAIISANADVLELEHGSSEWLTSIKGQIVRLDGLVRNLLDMAKMEDESVKVIFAEFSLSNAVLEVVDPFITLAEANGLTIKQSIQPEVVICGDEAAIHQLVSILLENAVKYTTLQGEITITLRKRDRGGTQLEIANPCQELPEGDLNRLFDRFYRVDASRARQTGGYGIGLSVARSIAQAHKAKLTAHRIDGWGICFVVNF